MKPTAGPRLARAAILDLLAALGFDESRRVTNIWIDPTEITVEFFDVDDLSQRREVKFRTDCAPMTVTMTTDAGGRRVSTLQQRRSLDGDIAASIADFPDWLDRKVWPRLDGYLGNGCWIWSGRRKSNGYGVVDLPIPGKGPALVHRVAWIAIHGALEAGLVLDHAGAAGCRNVACANPDHLDPVTPYVNNMITSTGPFAMNAAKTHCPKGHELTPGNNRLASQREGQRACRACDRERASALNALVREAMAATGLQKRQIAARYGYSRAVLQRLIKEGR